MNYEILNPNINLTENPVLLKVYLKFINNSYLENMYLNTIKSNLLMNLFIEMFTKKYKIFKNLIFCN